MIESESRACSSRVSQFQSGAGYRSADFRKQSSGADSLSTFGGHFPSSPLIDVGRVRRHGALVAITALHKDNGGGSSRPGGESLSLGVSAQIGSREEVISSGKVVRCPRGKVPNEVNARSTSHGARWLKEKPPGNERDNIASNELPRFPLSRDYTIRQEVRPSC